MYDKTRQEIMDAWRRLEIMKRAVEIATRELEAALRTLQASKQAALEEDSDLLPEGQEP
jgi:hypothetical protein